MSASRTILFVDDQHILYRSGTERVVTSFSRYDDNPVVSGRENPWEVALAWSSIYRNPDSGTYQLWYQAFTGHQLQKRTFDCAVCYAESDDGIHFERPMFDICPFQGESRSNIVLTGNGGYSLRYGNSVLVDPAPADPARRYKMAYFDFSGDGQNENPGLCTAFSPDGVHWTKHPVAPLSFMAYGRGGFGPPVPFTDDDSHSWHRPLTMSDAVDAMYDPIRKVYAIYGKMWIDGPDGGMFWKHGMGRIESRDFISWNTPELILSLDDQDLPHVEFHTAPVFYYEGYYFSLLQILDRGTGGGVIDIELMISRDGIQWNRPFRNTFVLPRSDHGDFDGGSIFTNATPVILDDEIRFYYGAYSGGATSADDRGHKSGIGLATIPRDRFAGIRPLPLSDQDTLDGPLRNIGQTTLKPIDLTRYSDITLNADASEGGIRVEVLDISGRRIRGWSAEDAVEVKGDCLAHRIQWRNMGVEELKGSHMIRIHLNNATAYAITLSPSRPR